MPRRLSVLAGSGALVGQVVEAALAAGDAVQVLSLAGAQAYAGAESRGADLGNPGAVLADLRSFGTSHVVMAGGISLSDQDREKLSRFFGGSGAGQSTGDAALSGLAVALRQLAGVEVIGVHEIATDLIADAGLMAGPAPDDGLHTSARLAFEAARHVGRLDLGQAAVVAGQRVVAVEDIAGTDELLARIGRYAAAGLVGDGAARLVLAKAAKPGQPVFVDLPAIGPVSVETCAALGIKLIAVEARKTLLLQRPALIAAANRHGIALLGLSADD